MDSRINTYNDKIYWYPQKPSMDESVSLVTGSKPGTSLLNQKISEEQLYAVLVHQKLGEKNPQLADRLAEALTSVIQQPNAQGKGENWSKAVDAILQGFVKSKDLTNSEFQEIKAFCFGHAQLDSNRSSLSGATNSENNLLLEALKYAVLNESASAAEMQESLKTSGASNTKTTTGANTSPTPTFNDTGAPSNVFLWKPVSDSDGRLAVLLPSNLSSSAIGAQIVGPEGRTIEKGRFTGIGNGGRQHYRFSKAGGSYPDGSSVVVTLRDGTTKTIQIKETSSRQEIARLPRN